MKIYYVGLVFYLFGGVNSALTVNTDVETVVEEISICDNYHLPPGDEIKKLIGDYSDEQFIKIISYSKLLKKNHSLYLCEIDKIIDQCFKLNNQRFNLNNFVRLLKASAFFACSFGCAYSGYGAWREAPNDWSLNHRKVGFAAIGVIASLFSLHGFSELQKIANNYDQNQLYYKAIAMKNALLGYRKK